MPRVRTLLTKFFWVAVGLLSLPSQTQVAAATSDRLEILIVAGQSNAVGFDADPSKLAVDSIDASIRFRYRVGDPPPDHHDSSSPADRWITLGPQLRGEPGLKTEPRQYGNFALEAGGFGPEISCARQLARHNGEAGRDTQLAVVKAAFSGTSVADDWDPSGTGERGVCYRALVDEVRTARKLAEAEGLTVSLRGLIWVQGESDANATDASNYQERLGAMFESLRRDLETPTLPVLVAVNVYFHEGTNKFMPEIIAAQKKLGHSLPHCRYVETQGASIANRVHFDADGTIEIGKRFASALLSMETPGAMNGPWTRHVVDESGGCMTSIANDFTGDGHVDIVCNVGGVTKLLVAPEWKAIEISTSNDRWIHSETMDVDGDGDPDVIGTPYNPGRIVWLECPENPLTDRWIERLIDDQVNGVHGLLVGNVDNEDRSDLLATSAQPTGSFPYSLVWYRIPKDPLSAERWDRFVFAANDAPGLSHYLGVGDIDGDGLPDATSAAKGDATEPGANGQWFAWWKAGSDPTQPWTKEIISADDPGATNIHPVDVNGDGNVDVIASRGHGVGVVWFERDMNTGTWTEHVIDGSLKEPHCLAAVDLDRDGDIDAATVAFGSERAMWYENDGDGVFSPHVIGENQQAYDIRVVDMDSDGDLDMVVAGRASNNVVWYENPL